MKFKQLFYSIMMIAVFFSCQQALNNFDGTKEATEKLVKINIGAKYEGNDLASSTRTIVPVPTVSRYWLYGKTDGDTEFQVLKYFDSLTGANVNIETGTWDLKLVATYATKDILEGTLTDVVISTSGTNLSFDLKPLETGKGSINIRLFLPANHPVYSDQITFGGSPAVLHTEYSRVTDSSNKLTGYTFTKSDVDRGDYLLIFKLKDVNEKVVVVVSEMVMVRPNLTTAKDITLVLTDFNAAPAKPESITYSLVESTEATGKIKIDWTDSSNNETGFVIGGDDLLGTNYIKNDIPPATTTYTWEGLLRGKTYRFGIQAKNDFGQSASCAPFGSLTVRVPYIVYFDSQGGSAVDPVFDDWQTHKITEPTAPTKSGYEFAGWYKEETCTKEWVFNDDAVSANTTLYAKWTATYSINYILDGGVNSGLNPDDFTIESARIVFYEPTKADKVFGGWFTDATFTNSITDIPAGSTGNKTVYAKWRNPIEPDQENQPGGEVQVPAVPDARAYWLAPSGMGNVGDIGGFVEGATMTTADETGLTSIAAPVTPGTYYLYFVIRDTKEILSISADYLTVLGDNVPFFYKGEIYAGFLDTVSGTVRKVTVQKTDLITGWQNVGDPQFSNSVDISGANLSGYTNEPRVAINKLTGDIWVVANEAQTSIHQLWVDIWKYTTADGWVKKQDINLNSHTSHQAMVMKNDGSAMYLSLSTWVSSSGAWPEYFQKRTGADFGTVETVSNYAPSVVKMGGDYLYMVSQTSDFNADDQATHTSKLSTHTGINVKKYDTTLAFNSTNMTTLGTDKFNVAGTTKYYAFKPEMYVEGDGTPYIVFVEPATYEHSRHKGNGTWQQNGWNDKFTDPKLTVMKYNGTDWELVGSNLFSPVVYKTTTNAYVAGTTDLRTGYNAPGDEDFTTTDSVFTPGICVGGGKVWVVSTDSSDKAFISAYDGSNWSTVKTDFATGVRNPKLVYDNGKLYILYAKLDGSGNETYTYIP